jgi:hypothetical protein
MFLITGIYNHESDPKDSNEIGTLKFTVYLVLFAEKKTAKVQILFPT